jgi:hypothetical protein
MHGVLVGRDVHAHQPGLVVAQAHVAVLEAHVPGAQAFDLRAHEGDARLEGFQQLVKPPGVLVAGDEFFAGPGFLGHGQIRSSDSMSEE